MTDFGRFYESGEIAPCILRQFMNNIIKNQQIFRFLQKFNGNSPLNAPFPLYLQSSRSAFSKILPEINVG